MFADAGLGLAEYLFLGVDFEHVTCLCYLVDQEKCFVSSAAMSMSLIMAWCLVDMHDRIVYVYGVDFTVLLVECLQEFLLSSPYIFLQTHALFTSSIWRCFYFFFNEFLVEPETREMIEAEKYKNFIRYDEAIACFYIGLSLSHNQLMERCNVSL